MSLTIPYTVFVHVIEARDLRGKDSNNLSDPYVVVSCHGQSQRTEITRNQVNVLWDRMFVFQDVLLNKDEFERDNIHIQVFDANIIMKVRRIAARKTFAPTNKMHCVLLLLLFH